jgi:fatty-acyl-CoA synthase
MASSDMIALLRQAVDGLEIPMVGTPQDFYAQPEGPEFRPAGRDDLCYIQYSSGSTSDPKGVIVSQRSASSNVRAIALHGLDVRQGDRCASWLPLYHDMGLIGFCISPTLCQLSVDYIATADFARRPLIWLRLISENRGTAGFSPSFGYDLCRRQGGNASAESLDLSCWRVAGVGGDMVRAGVLNRFAETFAGRGFKRSAFVPSYGLAESTLAVSFAPLNGDFEVDRVNKQELAQAGRAVPAAADMPAEKARSFVLCGGAMPEHEIEIRDQDGERLPDREVGRILVRGPSVMVGIFQDPESTAAVLSEDGWLDTGDLGYMINGSLVITGRSKDLIICNGRNIWPQDIEWAVERLPGIRNGDVAAFSVDFPETGEEVVTIVQCRTNEEDARVQLLQDVNAIVRKSVGVDTKIVLAPIRSLPLTSSGKISRTFTKVRYLSGYFAATPN